jgi:uncharacterized protein YjbJ (UPF0337 family)
MFKSAERNQAEGTLDRIAGSVLDFWGRITGSPKTRAKGKAAKGRGKARKTTAKAKRATR